MTDNDTIEGDREMAERHRGACRAITDRDLRDFYDWLRERFIFAQRIPQRDRFLGDGDLFESPETPEVTFAAYFDIDTAAVERHRRRVLGELAAAHEDRTGR